MSPTSTSLPPPTVTTTTTTTITATTPLPPPFTTTHPPPLLITQGAEAHLYRTHFLSPTTSSPHNHNNHHPCALKHRPAKPYRHPVLDRRLTKHRILSEARALVRCRREGVCVPGVLALDAEDGWLMVEWVDGRTVREVVRGGCAAVGAAGVEGQRGEGGNGEGLEGLMGRIGRAVGRMHEVGVVHGDLTTSNMMLRPPSSSSATTTAAAAVLQDGGASATNGEGEEHNGAGVGRESLEGDIVLIDFGLAGQSSQDEDKAVDLYVLERAFGSTHPEAEEGFQEVLRAYGESYKGAKVVLKRLEDVRMRGRKRSMLG